MDAPDLALELVYQTALYADYRQTRRIAEQPDKWFERNQVLGEHPTVNQVKAYFAGTAIGHAAISWLIPEGKWRTLWQGVTLGIEIGYVQQNIAIGIKF